MGDIFWYKNRNIINKIENENIDIRNFRDKVYDILVYNLDALDCIWYIFSYFVQMDYFEEIELEKTMMSISLFITRYGNNYRAIFHIESIIISMICNFKR